MICANDLYNLNLRQANCVCYLDYFSIELSAIQVQTLSGLSKLARLSPTKKMFLLWFSFKQIAWDPRKAKAKNTFYPKEIDHFVVAFFFDLFCKTVISKCRFD